MYKLESLARLISGRTPEREQKEYYAETGTPWVKIENLDQGYIRETAEYLSEQGKEKVNLVPENSVLFSIVGTVGKVGIAGRELATNQQIVSLIFDETRVLPLYGYYALRYHAEEIRKLSNQTTMALISRKTLGQYRIYVPDSLEKQQEIVDKLRRFEEIKLKKEEMRSRMEQYEQVLFQRIFASQLRYGEKARLRNYLKEPVGTGIPKNEEPNGEFPCVRLENFRKTYLTGLHAGEKAEVNAGADWAIEEKYRVCPGDILLRNGKLILVDRVEDPLYLDRSVLRIVPDQGQILPEALYAYLSQSCMSEVLYGARKEGDNRKRPIRAAEVEKLILPQLSMKKQEDYSRCLKKIREIERNLDREIALAEAAFSGMGWLLLRKEPEEEAKTDAISIEDVEIVTKAETEEFTGKDLETMADAKTSEGAAGEAEQTEAFEQIAEVVEQAQTGEEAPQVPLNEEETILSEYGELFLQNPDMVGWISIAGTKLNYPVMQTPNNPNFYLKHNFEKAYSDLGTPYIQENCNIAESDNLVIYGHHIKGGKMFGALNDYKSKSFYEEHKTILFDTLTEQAEYEIVAVFKTVAYSSEGFRYYDFVNAENAEAFDEYIAKCKELALYDTGVSAEYGDRLITLSTCEYSAQNGRLVVVAKKVS